jgi:hypothetical protein
MASEGEHVDADVAENLINAAKEALLEEPQAPSAQESSPASEFIQNVAHIALDKSNDAADSSKAYIESVVHEVQDYAQNTATGSTSNAQQTLSKAVHVQAYPRSATGDASSVSPQLYPNFGRAIFMSCQYFDHIRELGLRFTSFCGSRVLAMAGF